MVDAKWEPFRDLMVMQDRMTRLLDETLGRIWKEEAPRRVWSPPVDIIERTGEVVLKIDVPEVNQDSINIRIEENNLIVEGERQFAKETPDENYLQIERPSGAFQRTFAMPRLIEQEKIKASYKDGVLRIVLPKKEVTQPRLIIVEES